MLATKILNRRQFFLGGFPTSCDFDLSASNMKQLSPRKLLDNMSQGMIVLSRGSTEDIESIQMINKEARRVLMLEKSKLATALKTTESLADMLPY